MGEPTLYTNRFRVMGGWGLLRFVDDRGTDAARKIAGLAVAEAERIERKFSRYLDSSVVARINRDAGRTPVAVDEETVELVERALDLARKTRGAFDPTVGILRRAWDFREGRVPDDAEIASLLELVDWRDVSVRNGTVFLRRAGMELDLGGVGKEYAADRVADSLKRDGVTCGIVNLSGDLRVIGGRSDGRPWSLGVIDPRDRERCRFAIRLVGEGGVASSGDYERFFERDGIRYHHILDARTGKPARGIASATVVAGSAFEAGLLATGSFLLGADEGLALIEATSGAEGALVTEDGALVATTGMARVSDLPGSLYASYPGI